MVLKNFRSHKDTSISLGSNSGENITVIVGDNGAGKTSILDGICFALFKGKPMGVSTSELITLGKDEGEVSLTFHSDGRKYRVLRKRTRKGGAESFLFHLDGDGQSLVAMREKEVTKEIEDVLGLNGELFTNAVYIKQGEIDRLFTDDSAKRKKHIGRLIGIEEIESAYQNFVQILNHFDLEIKKLDDVSAKLEEKKEKRGIEIAEARTLETDLKGLKENLDSEKKIVEDMDKKIEILDRLRLKLDGKKRLSNELTYLHDRIKKIEYFEEQLSSNEKERNKADLLEKEIEDLREKTSELKVLAERRNRDESELRIEREKKARIEKELSEIVSRGSSILKIKIDNPSMLESGKDEALSSLEKEIRAIDKEKDKNLKIFAEKEAQIVSLDKSLEEISSAGGACPVCGRELKRGHKASLIKHHSSEIGALKKEVETAKIRLQNLKLRSDSCEKMWESINRLNIDVFKEKQGLYDDSVKKISFLGKNLEGYKSSLEKLAQLDDKLVVIKKEYLGLLTYRDRYNAAQNFLRKEHPEKEKLENRIRGLEKEIEGLEREIDSEAVGFELDLASLHPEYDRLKKELSSARNSQIEHEKKFASIQAALKHVKKRIEELKVEIRELEEQVKERRSLKAFKDLLERIRQIFHKDRLQKELRVRARPLIEEYTRDVFLSFNLPYSDVTLTDDYSIIVHGPKGEERVDMLSGGERIAAALALRVGLSRALSGQKLELLILDEPTIHLDSQRRRELVDIIKNLSLIPQTIVVTHDKEFEEAADRVIEVEKVNGVSVVR